MDHIPGWSFGAPRGLSVITQSHRSVDQVDEAQSLVKSAIAKIALRRDADADDLVDIDELSSGEKSVIALFLPYLESGMLQKVGEQRDGSSGAVHTTLLDVPEIHLHPSLQAALMDYLRKISSERNHQFIMTSHSPTLMDSTRDDELFVLLPLNVVGDRNQRVRVWTMLRPSSQEIGIATAMRPPRWFPPRRSEYCRD